MDSLPSELLSDIINQDVLTNIDLIRLSCVNRHFNSVACARLYRTGELSYVGATSKDREKFEAFGKNGKHVRHINLNLFASSVSGKSVPEAIFPLLKTFINLHSVTLIDTASLTWPDFLHVIAIIITSHPYLKILEIQRSLTKLDGNRSDITTAIELMVNHQFNGGTFCKLDMFTLRLSKREDPLYLPRSALNHLIQILTPATRSAKSFTYSAEVPESAEIDLKDPWGEDIEALSWPWDNLEYFTLKLPVRYSQLNQLALQTRQPRQILHSYQKDLQNVEKLAIRARVDDVLATGQIAFEGGLSVMPKLNTLRLSHAGGFTGWDPRNQADHPFVKIAEAIPTLEFIQQTDPYYMTQVIQAWRIFRDDGEITFKVAEIGEAWDHQFAY